MTGSGKSSGIVLDVARQKGGPMPGIVTLLDHSRFGNHGAMANVTWVQLPSRLWVMSFNGTNAIINLVGYPSLDIIRDITISFWFNTSDTKATAFPLGRGDTGNIGWITELWIGAQIAVSIGNGGAHGYDAQPYVTGTWAFVVARRLGNAVEIFVNGVGSGSPAVLAGSIDYTGVDLAIGHRSIPAGNPARYFHGQIGLVRIYNYGLTPAQIRARYKVTKNYFGDRFAT